MRNQFNTSFKFSKETSYVGGIQLSKGMLWAKMKREEEAKNTKVVNKIFSNQAPAHSNTKKNQPVITSSSQRSSVKASESWASTPRTTYTSKPKNSPRESFRSTKTSFELIDSKESKLLKLSKKIAKYEAPTREPLYKAPVKRLAKNVVKQPAARVITTSTLTAPIVPQVVHAVPKIAKKVFKEDTKKNVAFSNQPVFREQRNTNIVSKSFDFKSWGTMQHETSYKEPVPSNKYRAAMRARKVPCETLKYKSVISRKEHKFKCFKEKDLGIPKQFCSKIIHHTVDNDCYTDDEQLGLAVKNLYFSLRLATEEIAV